MKIRYFAWLKNITNTDSEELDEPSIQDIDSLKKFLCNKYPKLDPYINKEEIVRFAINLEYTTTNDKLSLCDEVALFPPVSGG
ncbi:MoaD/ThiS family protein [Alphaproteobacteria bacterium]|nr:MoaD/ThiS family protein [Alphaproteobacteria bacterium]